MILTGRSPTNESVKYNDTKRIKTLYHSVFNDKAKDYVLKNGIKCDQYHWVYLSEKPIINKLVKAVFLVTIPKNDLLYDWREIWCDEDGNEIDMDHEYDPNNPYYMYNADIPKQYVKLYKEMN